MADTPEFLASLDRQPGLLTQFRALFRGTMGRLTLLVYAMAILTFAFSIWLLEWTLHATDTRALILGSTALIACWTAILMMKLWIWNRLNTLAILRAIERARRG